MRHPADFRPFAAVRRLALAAIALLLGFGAASWSRGADSYQAGDDVEIFWGEKWYPGAVLEAKDGKYKVHYEGYGNNWDEWAQADRLRRRSQTPTEPGATARWKKGDKVDAWNVTWYPAEILIAGSGDRVGYYKVHYENFSGASDQWLVESSIRDRAGAPIAAAPATEATPPRLGTYRIYSYGAAGSRIYLGELELQAGNLYRVTRLGGNVTGSGQYAFDAAQSAVTWLSGPNKDDGWAGGFEISREGKTHTIRLRRGTVALNSTD